MPTNKDLIKQIGEAVYHDGQKAISEFRDSDNNKDVYAFVIEYDAVNASGRVIWNTLAGHERSLQESSYDYTPEEINDVHGIKFNSGDFLHDVDFGDDTDVLFKEFFKSIEDKSSAIQARAEDKLRNELIKTLKRLRPSFVDFNRTKDFIAFVCDWQRSKDEWVATMQATIPAKLFEQIFSNSPAAKLENERQRIAKLGNKQRAQFLIDEIVKLYQGKKTPFVRLLDEADLHAGTIIQEDFCKMGLAGFAPALAAIEKHIKLPQEKNKNAVTKKGESRKLPAADICYDLIEASQKMVGNGRKITDKDVARVYRCLKEIFGRVKSVKDEVAPTARMLADLLNILRPKKYPSAKISGGYVLLNWSEYGLPDPAPSNKTTGRKS